MAEDGGMKQFRVRLLAFGVCFGLFAGGLTGLVILLWIAGQFIALQQFDFPWAVWRFLLAMATIPAFCFATSDDAVSK
jgi:hypothetical protein